MKKPEQRHMIPPAPSPNDLNGGEHVFFSSDKVKIYAQANRVSGYNARKRFTIYRSSFPQPGQENVGLIADFNEWDRAFLAGERAARFEEGREVDAGYAAAFGPKKRVAE